MPLLQNRLPEALLLVLRQGEILRLELCLLLLQQQPDPYFLSLAGTRVGNTTKARFPQRQQERGVEVQVQAIGLSEAVLLMLQGRSGVRRELPLHWLRKLFFNGGKKHPSAMIAL